jgi:hypothetical protein
MTTEPELGVDEEHLEQIKRYVERNKHAGRDILREKLLNAGWPEEAVDYALDDIL